MTQQLTLELPLRQAFGRQDFFVSPANALVLAALEDWRHWPEGKAVLQGPEASGKSHLAQIWADLTQAQRLSAESLSRSDPAALAEQATVIEDLDRIARDSAAQTALVHLHNLMAARGVPLLLTTAKTPGKIGFALPDLVSRLQAAPLLRIGPPEDALLIAVMAKMFADRQIHVAPDLLEWAAQRMTRSLAAARDLVETLDARALAEGRAISRAMIEDWLMGDTLFPLD